ncbi:hypothetical protein BLOT_007925 [Blomia tropicalis]|nr:hypothetical protein BLOT_007925 [Blomia tropicalis]
MRICRAYKTVSKEALCVITNILPLSIKAFELTQIANAKISQEINIGEHKISLSVGAYRLPPLCSTSTARLLMRQFLFALRDFNSKLVKVDPVLWKESQHHIKSSKLIQDTLIVIYLDDPCLIFGDPEYLLLFKSCKQFYKSLITELIIDHCEQDYDLFFYINFIFTLCHTRTQRD